MAMNGVPLFIGGNAASHTAENSRIGQFVQFSGEEGVVLGGDMKVVEGTPTAGGYVMINPGACAILARGPQQHRQMYSWGFGSAKQLDVPANTTSSPRHHLVIMRVEDPYDGTGQWPVPTDTANGPYIHPRLELDVPEGTTSIHDLQASRGIMSAITLARIEVPANTSAIIADYIKPLRELSGAMERSHQLTKEHGALEEVTMSAGWQYIPSTADHTFRVPSWATIMDTDISCTPMRLHNPDHVWDSTSHLWGRIGLDVDGVITGSTWFNSTFVGPYNDERTRAAEPIDVSGKQGELIRVRVVHELVGASVNHPNGVLQAYEYTSTVFRVTFRQEII